MNKTNVKVRQIAPDGQDHRKQRLVASGKFERVNADQQATAEAFMNQLYNGIGRQELRYAINVLQQMDHNLGGMYE